MLTAMINGESNPLPLADLAKGKMRRKTPDLGQALTGTFDAHHAQQANSMLRRLQLVEQALAELDVVIAEACRPWAHQIELLQTIPGVGETVAESSWPRPARPCPGFRAPIWLLGLGWRRRCTSPPADRPRPGSGTATNG
jgi:transposase